jgi:ATP-dependent DNA helicase RecG
LADPILDAKEIDGTIPEQLRQLDEVMRMNIRTAVNPRAGTLEELHPDYPFTALQQLVRNAVMHRNYEGTSAPVRFTWFDDRVEILNPGGPYGQVTRDNFWQPGIADYRNPNLAAALKDLGFVQRFGVGISIARQEMAKNENPPLAFTIEETHVLVTLRRQL